MANKLLIFCIISCFLVIFCNCKNQTEEDEINTLKQYVTDTKLKDSVTKSGLYYYTINKGTTQKLTEGDTAILQYKGITLKNVIFYSTTPKNPLKIRYKKDNIIKGIDEALGKIHLGDSIRLVIPSKLAYGKSRYGVISPYTTLEVYMKLTDIKKSN